MNNDRNAHEFRQNVRDMNNRVFNTLVSKAKDYGPANIAAIGIPGILSRLEDKMARLRNLHLNALEAQVKDETIEDTWIDVAGYAIIAMIYLAGRWPQSRIPEDDAIQQTGKVQCCNGGPEWEWTTKHHDAQAYALAEERATSRVARRPLSVYLGGPVDNAADPHGWRREMAKALGPEVTSFFPNQAFNHSIERGHNGFVRSVNDFAVITCDVAIFYLPKDVVTIGTPMEIDLRRAAGGPMVVVTELKAAYLYDIQCVRTFEEAVEYVKSVQAS